MLRIAISTCCFIGTLFAPILCHAWGKTGHKIVAAIAYELLEPKARNQANKILDENFVNAALWADAIKEDRPDTGPWHYINTPPGKTVFDLERDCVGGNCVVAQIQSHLRTLENERASRRSKREALKFLIHLVADIHQPLHASRATDRGGNNIRVSFFGTPTNLHAAWDNDILEKFLADNRLSWRKHARSLSKNPFIHEMIEPGEQAVIHWANSSRALSESLAYVHPDGQPVRSGERLGAAYYTRAAPVVNESLRIAGIRLAHVLNLTLSK